MFPFDSYSCSDDLRRILLMQAAIVGCVILRVTRRGQTGALFRRRPEGGRRGRGEERASCVSEGRNTRRARKRG